MDPRADPADRPEPAAQRGFESRSAQLRQSAVLLRPFLLLGRGCSRVLTGRSSTTCGKQQGLNCGCSVAESYLALCDPWTAAPPGSSVRGISQARTLEGLPSPPPGDLPDPGSESVSGTGRRILYRLAPGGAPQDSILPFKTFKMLCIHTQTFLV